MSRLKIGLLTILFALFVTASTNAQDALYALWNDIAFAKSSSCLLGTQYNFDRTGERFELTIFNNDPWKLFVRYGKHKTTKFLLEKLADTTKTSVHTCPFMAASNGELAVYALQQIHHKNWYDFEAFSAYANREVKSATDNHQGWLRTILTDDSERKKLEALFRNY